jgi:hypothetical protein
MFSFSIVTYFFFSHSMKRCRSASEYDITPLPISLL